MPKALYCFARDGCAMKESYLCRIQDAFPLCHFLPNVENVLFLDVTHWTLIPNVENAWTRGAHNSVCMWKNNRKIVCVCVSCVWGKN